MSGLPKGWVEATIGEVCDYVQRGKSPKYTKVSRLPVINQKCVRWSGIDERYLKFVDPEQWSSWTEERFLITGDVLWNSTGTGTIGRAALFRGLRVADRAVVDSHVTILRPGDAISGPFLYRFIQSPSIQNAIADMQSGTTNQVELNRAEIVDTTLPLPPLAEQKRIVTKLDALNAKSARARTELARIETLVSRYKQAVLNKAFGGGLPREWPLVSLDRLSETIFDGPFGSNLKSADYTPDGPRVVRLENIGARTFIEEKRTHISEEKFRALARHVLQANDLLFSSFVSEEIRACLFPADVDFQAINKADCFCIRLDKAKIVPKFALFQLTAEATYTHFVQKVHGATRPRINLSQLKHYPLLAPPLEEQREIVRRIESAFARMDRLAVEARRALGLVGKLDEAILSEAFRGELVPQDENDEPAERLLARIRAERAATPKAKPKSFRRKTTMLTAKNFLKEKIQNWPEDGISFQKLLGEFSGSYDDLKDAVFSSLSGEKPMLQQVFDEKRSIMTLRKRGQ